MEYDFSVDVAMREEQTLKDAARTRVINQVHQKKRLMQKEKELLDSADSTALLHSTGFTITQPGSPGGPASNRKTRHTRHHRPDPDNHEALEGNRRKRKAPLDFDNGSPGPGMRMVLEGPSILWEKNKVASEHDPMLPASVDKFFNSRELTTYSRAANNTVAHEWAEKRPKSHLTNGKVPNGLHSLTNGSTTDTDNGHARGNQHSDGEMDDDETTQLVAPAMDRTGSHATRSTRNNQLEAPSSRDPYDGLDNPRRVFGSAVLEASSIRAKVNSNKDIEAPLTSCLSAQEIADDLAFFQQAITEDL